MPLRSFDVVVGLKAHLWASGESWSFERLGGAVGVSASQAHASLRRLAHAGLYRDGDRSLRVHAFTAFAAHGIPHVFPADVGPPGFGMPTAHAAPPLCHELLSAEAYVWPAPDGVAGRLIAPLHPAAPAAAALDSRLYAALALVDALRVGRARDRELGASALDALLREPARDVSWARVRRAEQQVG